MDPFAILLILDHRLLLGDFGPLTGYSTDFHLAEILERPNFQIDFALA